MTATTTRAAECWAHMTAAVDPMPVCVALDWLCEENGDDIRDVYALVEACAQRHLDAKPDDHAARRLLGEWLTACGDERGAGYVALAVFELHTYSGQRGRRVWFSGHEYPASVRKSGCTLPGDWYESLRVPTPNWHHWRTRRTAENAAAFAFLRLPESRRAELMKGEM